MTQIGLVSAIRRTNQDRPLAGLVVDEGDSGLDLAQSEFQKRVVGGEPANDRRTPVFARVRVAARLSCAYGVH